MKIKEVGYSRLFNLENYSNERISFVAEVGENEDDKVVMGNLFLKAIEVENSLQAYRSMIAEYKSIENQIESTERDMEYQAKEIVKLDDRLKEYKEKAKEEPRYQCSVVDTSEQLEYAKERLDKLKKKQSDLLRRKVDLDNKLRKAEELIEKGEFLKVVLLAGTVLGTG